MARDLLGLDQDSPIEEHPLRHPSIKGLYANWFELFMRNGRRVPERRQVEPASLHRWLGDVFVLEWDHCVGLRYRLVGSNVCSMFGREMAGLPFTSGEDLTTVAVRHHAENLGARIQALVIHETLATHRGDSIEAETIILPLLHDGVANQRALGARAALTRPSWLGVLPVTSTQIEGLRIVEPLEERALLRDRVIPLAEIAPTEVRQVAHLTVFEGGKRPLVTQT